jgi:hypothetical protein
MPSITARQRAQQGRVLAQMIPDPGVREQLQVCISPRLCPHKYER